ncbi:ribonuclease HI [Tumebacillus algifaecis]|uniref:Ribonuclease H n=1 Tax=Tumebacillus algifaecis TaxID=1214604 RepID=A0A223CZ83_9BACL|nr:ribonuclease HI [Tumebacillus algifaecis]ASS74466.1 ribonuclease HI [Tumebacillus algifaecis]
MKEVVIYTDGACSGNPGPGGYGAVLMAGEHRKEISGGERETTNQRMELLAVIEALKLLKYPCKVDVYSDSAYLINCFKSRWYVNWEKNGWLNSQKQPVANRDLWEELLRYYRTHQIQFVKVKGHSGDHWNERCDQLARAAVPR